MFVVMAVLLFQRIFTLQIVQGEDKQQEFELKIKKERSIASTRGNIYDVNGIALAYNEQEKNITTYNLARMNMLLHGVKDSEFQIHHGDSLLNDWNILNEMNPAKKMPQLTVSSKKSFIFWTKTATASAAISIFISMATANLPTA